jgi:DNA-directed RNA polymerase specialized sigma24 family protein
MGVTDKGIAGDREFPSTSWSVILQVRDPDSPDYARHLGRLVELYWRPVYGVIRHAWAKSHDDAKDLTQDFFATVVFQRDLLKTYAPERGTFRSLLRRALAHFMRDANRDSRRQKRGGGALPVSLERIGEDAIEAIPGADRLTPEQIFDLAWNETVMSEAVAILEKKLKSEGKAAAFEVFRRYDMEGDSVELSYEALGASLSMTAPQVKHALIHAREAFRAIVTDIVRGYVDDPADLENELRSLFGG